MNAWDQFACLSGIDDDLIADAVPTAWRGAERQTRNRLAVAYDRFMSSGWVAAVLSVVVALGVITGIVMLSRGGLAGLAGITPGGHVESTDRESSREPESLPVAGEDFVWIVKDGKSDFATHSNFNTAGDAAQMLSERIYALTGEYLRVLPYGDEGEAEHGFFFSRSIDLGEQGYRISLSNGWIYFAAASDAGFERAIARFLSDAAVQGGLALPPDYRVEDSGKPLWLVKDGRAQFHISMMHSASKANAAVSALVREIESLSGATLPMAPENMENVEWLIEFIDDDHFGEDGFFLHANGWYITVMASSEQGFLNAVSRLTTDLWREGNSLSLPGNYMYEKIGTSVGEETTTPSESDTIPDAVVRAAADRFLLEEYPALAAVGLDAFAYEATQYRADPYQYSVRYEYLLCKKETYEYYLLTLVWNGNGFTLNRADAANVGEISKFHAVCTPDMIQAAQAELRALSGSDHDGYLEVNNQGELLLTAEVIVPLTPPLGVTEGGCGIDHEHQFYSVVVCSAPDIP